MEEPTLGVKLPKIKEDIAMYPQRAKYRTAKYIAELFFWRTGVHM
jgi:hypothetical protein